MTFCKLYVFQNSTTKINYFLEGIFEFSNSLPHRLVVAVKTDMEYAVSASQSQWECHNKASLLWTWSTLGLGQHISSIWKANDFSDMIINTNDRKALESGIVTALLLVTLDRRSCPYQLICLFSCFLFKLWAIFPGSLSKLISSAEQVIDRPAFWLRKLCAALSVITSALGFYGQYLTFVTCLCGKSLSSARKMWRGDLCDGQSYVSSTVHELCAGTSVSTEATEDIVASNSFCDVTLFGSLHYYLVLQLKKSAKF